MCRAYFQVLFIGMVLVFSHESYAGKKECKPYLVNLRNIQSQQKQGHNLKRSESLNKQEAKARKKWWRCEQGLLKKVAASKSKNKSKNYKLKNSTVKHQPISEKARKGITKVNKKPFRSTVAVVVKSRYQGLQLYAWLEYYQQPEKCRRPKNTKQFAFCVEDRRKQQLAFELVFNKSDATVNVK